MQSSKEKEEFSALLVALCNNDEEAYSCALLATTYFHTFDDIVDGDVALSARSLVSCNNILTRLLTCAFFDKHRRVLLPQLYLIGNDYVTSNEEPSQWDILRHAGNNFLRAVALITGDEEHFNNISKQLRDFSVKYQRS